MGRTKTEHAEDILFSLPWNCGGDDGCTAPGHWHQMNFWCYSNGRFGYDAYSDGDHEPITKRDLDREWKRHDAAWRAYSQFVLDTGTDPLGEFIVRHVRTRKERWQVKFSHVIGGARIVAARHGRTSVALGALPAYVRQYCLLPADKPTSNTIFLGVHDDDPFESWAAFVDAIGLPPRYRERLRTKWATFTIERTIPRSPERVARDLRRLARRHLRQKAGAA